MRGFDGLNFVSGMGSLGEVVTLGSLGAIAAPPPTPNYPVTGDPRQKSVNSPGQVRIDAAMLRTLNFAAPDTGNAYDPKFMAAVRGFQVKAGPSLVGPADGLIGPQTRAVLVDAARLADPDGDGLPSNGGGGGGLLDRISTDDGPDYGTIALYGLGALAIGGIAYYFATK